MFSDRSRYRNLETVTRVLPDGRDVLYVRRRFLPPAGGPILAEHVVGQGDRLDNITAQYVGDPEQFWRLCDANGVMSPADLTREVNQRVLIPLPGGRP